MSLRSTVAESGMPRKPAPPDVLERIWKTLEGDPRLRLQKNRLMLALEDGELTIEGEVADVAEKTRTLEIVQVFPEVHYVVDRLVVEAPVRMGDGEMRDLFGRSLLGEPVFSECQILLWAEGEEQVVQDPEGSRGRIEARIDGGIITLEGEVPSLSHARLAGVLAWWIPGTRDVRLALDVSPPEEDNDDELTDAIRIVLEKEPFVDAGQLSIRTAGGHVLLGGTVSSDEQRRLAERDVWYVDGVLEVHNQIVVYMH